MHRAWPAVAALALLGAGCSEPAMADLPKLTVTSTAYREGGAIPATYTCKGLDQSPPWAFSGLPAGARYWAAVFDDPDAPGGTWTHWTWWDLPSSTAGLAAGADVTALGAAEGLTSAKSVGYHGPCPPGGTHRYVLHLYATKEPLGLRSGASIADLHAALKAKAVASGTLTGTFAK